MLTESVSIQLLQPLYRMQRRLRPATRPAYAAYRSGMRFRQAALDWSDDRRRDWLLERLRHVVRRAAAEIPFHAERFRTAGFDPASPFDFDDFARLPILERGEIRDAGSELLAGSVAPAQRRRDSTGGSTGEPTVLWTGPEERGWRESGSDHFMERIGIRNGMRRALLWGHHLDPVASDRLGDRLRAAVDNIRWFDCLRLSPEVLQRYHEQMQEWQPRCIVAYAGALGALAERIRELGRVPSYPTRALITGAEKLLPHHREVAESVFGRPVHERYGSRDVGLMAFQLREAGSLALNVDWANVLLEPETNERDAPILVTKLNADAMPMIRYRVGDVGRFPASGRCGHPTFVLEEVVGREVDRIWLPDGRFVNGLAFPHLMKDLPVRTFQILQDADYAVTVRVVPAGAFDADARALLERMLHANLSGVSVRVELVEAIERTRSSKWRPVISAALPTSRSGASS